MGFVETLNVIIFMYLCEWRKIVKMQNKRKSIDWNKYEYCLFDLDGTLTNPELGITNSFMYALSKYNISVCERSELHKVIGPPLLDSFQKFYDFSYEDAKDAVDYYREYYKEKGIYENEAFPGISSLLEMLQKQGKKIVLATSKPEHFAKIILDYFNLTKYFTFIAGANMDETRTKKDEVIEYALESCGIIEMEKVLMIGDREYDIIGAKKFGIDSVGVLFGFGTLEELERAGSTYIVESVQQMMDTIY